MGFADVTECCPADAPAHDNENTTEKKYPQSWYYTANIVQKHTQPIMTVMVCDLIPAGIEQAACARWPERTAMPSQ